MPPVISTVQTLRPEVITMKIEESFKAYSRIVGNEYAVKVGDLQRVRIPPGQLVARPEATRAMEEVTNLLKYSGVTGHLG